VSRCEWTDICPFFGCEVGFSPDLNRTMRERYCLGDNSECARMEIFDLLPMTRIPEDLIPSDRVRVAELVKAYRDAICAEHRK